MQHFFVMLLALLLAFQNCQAVQEGSDKFIADTYLAAGRTVQLILDRLNLVLPDYAKKLAVPKNFIVYTAPDYGAFAKYETGKVILPLGIVVETRMVLLAYQDVADDMSLQHKLTEYFAYLASRQQRMREQHTAEPLKTFAQWNGHTQKTLAAAQQSERLNQEVAVMVNALSFVVAHELAHLALQHKDASTLSASDSRAQENEADLHAMVWIRKAGFDPLPAALLLLRMGYAQVSADNQLIQYETHDHPLCRLWLRFAPEISRRSHEASINEGAIRAGFQSAKDMALRMTAFKEACIR
jgi:hypothetical protein